MKIETKSFTLAMLPVLPIQRLPDPLQPSLHAICLVHLLHQLPCQHMVTEDVQILLSPPGLVNFVNFYQYFKNINTFSITRSPNIDCGPHSTATGCCLLLITLPSSSVIICGREDWAGGAGESLGVTTGTTKPKCTASSSLLDLGILNHMQNWRAVVNSSIGGLKKSYQLWIPDYPLTLECRPVLEN